MGIPLRIAEPTGRHVRYLRRFIRSSESACPGGYHNASVSLGETTTGIDEPRGDTWPHDDPRWPSACEACGYRFTADDHWQASTCEIYRLPDGSEFEFRRSLGQIAPAGTMIRIPWFDEYAADFGRAGESWLIALPDGGEWITTQSATGGGHWDVTGTPPLITAHPSIWHNQPVGWHGWVRDGELVDA